jgi:hypothetical protein
METRTPDLLITNTLQRTLHEVVRICPSLKIHSLLLVACCSSMPAVALLGSNMVAISHLRVSIG